jgi:hypothetical protein
MDMLGVLLMRIGKILRDFFICGRFEAGFLSAPAAREEASGAAIMSFD